MKTGARLVTLIATLVVFALVIVLALLVRAGGRPPPKTALTGVTGGAAPVDFEWDGPTTCYPPKMVAECVEAARAIPGHAPVTPTERARLAAAASRLGEKYGVPIGAEPLVAIRTMEAALAARYSGLKAQRHGEALHAGYAAGESVLALARRYKVAPLAALRQILVEEGHSEAQVKAMVASPQTLPPRLAAEAAAISEADLSSRVNADRIKAKAQAYEDAVGAHLAARGLRFKTENELRADHERRNASGAEPAGELRATPDFLFTAPTTIGGRPVAWLDAKDYPAVGSKLVARSLAKQAEKYTALFGPGAMVFSGGLMCGARVLSRDTAVGPPPLLLDGSHIRPRE